jgi:ribonuclease VapC
LIERIAVDSSALIAILLNEPEQDRFLDILFESRERKISAFSVLEAGAVILSRKGQTGRLIFDSLCEELLLEIAPLTPEQSRLARLAWERFGKGRHPAGLNLGDCCSYALARSMEAPLLCKGGDFVRTDLDLVSF